MPINVIQFPLSRIAANDDTPSGPGGSSVSVGNLQRCVRIVRSLRGINLHNSTLGCAKAA